MKEHATSPHHHADPWTGRTAMYDRLAAAVEPEMRLATEAMLDAVQAGAGTRLLDLACGPGHTTDAARARGANALGIDIAPGMIESARRRFPGGRYRVGDMLDPPEGPWDAIVCRLGAHHVEDAWLGAAWRALVPGGRLAIAELGAEDQASRDKGMRPAASWVRLFEEAGFEDISVRTLALRLGTAAARDALLARMGPEGHGGHHDGPVHIIAGRKPFDRSMGPRER